MDEKTVMGKNCFSSEMFNGYQTTFATIINTNTAIKKQIPITCQRLIAIDIERNYDTD